MPQRAKPMKKKRKKRDSDHDSERSSQKSSNKEEEDDDDDDERNKSTLWDWIVGIAGDEKAENYRRENQNDSYYSYEKQRVNRKDVSKRMGYLEKIRRSNENFVEER